jgi:hypothetical protein
MKPWDYIRYITKKTKPKDFEYDKKLCSGWLLSYFLSHSFEYLPIVQKMNLIQFKVKDQQIFDYYYDRIPRSNAWLNMPKKAKDKDEKKEIEEIKLEYNVSKREAQLIRIYKERLCKKHYTQKTLSHY